MSLSAAFLMSSSIALLFLCGNRDLLTVQHVPEWVYRATYPAWFLSEKTIF